MPVSWSPTQELDYPFWRHMRFKKSSNLSSQTYGALAYIELYRSHPALSTWGNRIRIGAIKGGTLAQAEGQPYYSFLGIKEITYHWVCTPSWQLNLSIGLLINWWTKNKQDRPKLNQENATDQLNTNKKTLTFAPLITMGIRYITHTIPFLQPGNHPIYYRKRKSSRIDCSIASNSRKLASTKEYYFNF